MKISVLFLGAIFGSFAAAAPAPDVDRPSKVLKPRATSVCGYVIAKTLDGISGAYS